MATHSYDSQCYDLAEYFFPGAPRELLSELAQRLQDQVESSPELDKWLEAKMQEDTAEADRTEWERTHPDRNTLW